MIKIEVIYGIVIWMEVIHNGYNLRTFDDLQIEEYKEKLHKEMFWLLLYKDPKTKDEFKNVDFEKYFINLMKKSMV